MSKVKSRSRTMVAAVMLGTAITAGSASASAAVTPTPTELSPAVLLDLSKYCQVCWRNARLPVDRWSDCTQQVFVRLIERVQPNRWGLLLEAEGQDKRELLRAIDAVKKRTQRARRFTEMTPDQPDNHHQHRLSQREQWEAVNRAAERVLSPRQRKIVELTATGWAVPEIAAELGTTPDRVSDEKYKAICKLRAELQA